MVQSLGDLSNTCGSLGHSRHRTAAGPAQTNQSVRKCKTATQAFQLIHQSGDRRYEGSYIVLRCATNVAALALDALPAVGLHRSHHHGGELQTRWVA